MSKNEFTLDDIMNDTDTTTAEESTNTSSEKYGAVNISDIRPVEDFNKTKNDAEKEVMGEILTEVDRKMSQIHENKELIKESIINSAEQEAFEEEMGESSDNNKISVTSAKKESEDDYISTDEDVKSYSFEDEDFAELEKELSDSADDEDSSSFTDEDLAELSEEIKQHVKPVSNSIDISNFTINVAAEAAVKRNTFVADWVLVDTGRVISMRSFDTDDLDKLERAQSYRTTTNALTDVWTMIYDHCEDPNKPNTMSAWLKNISSLDIPHIYAAIYKASFQNNSYIPYECNNPDCKKSFIPGVTPFESMVKYNTDETKAYVENILAKNITTKKTEPPVLLQVSDDIVIEFTRPSIYSIIFENIGLDADIRTKFGNILDIINYISNIYLIDRATSSLKPISCKEYRDNALKTTKAKIFTYSKILKTLSSDQRGMITGKINTMVKDDTDRKVTYVYPAVECTRCHHMTSEQEVDPASVLFMRHRLTALMK